LTSTENRNHAPGVRTRTIALAVALSSVACKEERTPEPSVPDSGLTPIQRTITATRTATTAVVAPPPPSHVVPTEGCPTAPKWASTPPCVKDGFLYASGEHKSPATALLSRSAAASRARRRLATALGAHDNDTFTLKGSEIDQVYVCGPITYALARIPQKQGEFKACTADQLAAPEPKKGCPKWTTRMAWKEGNTLYAVTPAMKVMQRTQADQAAVNRARQTVAEMLEVELKLTPEGATASVPDTALSEKRRSSAECDGARWMMVAFEAGTSDAITAKAKKKGPTERMQRLK
jgi:hypothetical protein